MSRYLFNPMMPSTDFASRIARGGGGGGGGGGSDNPPMRVEVPSNDPADALKVANDLNDKYSNRSDVNYARGYNPNTGEVSVVNIGDQSEGGSDSPAPREKASPAPTPEPTPTPTPTPAPTPEPEPEQPAPEVPSSEKPGPVFTPQQPEDLPDALPTSAAEDQVVVDVQKPTYTPVDSVRSNITAPTDDLEATSTFSKPLASAGLSAVPDQVTVRPQYTGTTMRNLTTPSQGIQSVQQVVYKNRRGQTLNVTEMNGAPLTYVPPGYEPAARMNQMMEAERTLELPTQTVTQAPPAGTTEAAGSIAQGLLSSNILGFAEGGSVQDAQLDGMYRMATKFLGYTGPKTREALSAFRNSSPAVAAKMQRYAKGMAKGGMVRRGFAEGGVAQPLDPNAPDGSTGTDPTTNETMYRRNGQWLTQDQLNEQVALENYARDQEAIQFQDDLAAMQREAVTQTMQPRQATVQPMLADAADFIAPTAGQTAPVSPMAEAATVGSVELAQQQQATQAALMQPTTVAPQVQQVTGATQAAQGQVAPEAQVTAAQGAISPEALAEGQKYNQDYLSMVDAGTLPVTPDQIVQAQGQDEIAPAAKIAQSTGIDPAIAAQGVVSQNELPTPAQIAEADMAQAQAIVSGGQLSQDATAVAAKLRSFTVDAGTLAQAAQGNVNAQDTVQGQLASLMKQFDDGTPVWAAGAMRAANAAMAARGLGGSSMAGTAIVQAAMESALPIAAQDAQTFAAMNMSNLDRRQQVALANAAAQQGLALQNLNNEQQAALQNSANAFQLQVQDLSNMQQVVLANAQIKAALQGQNLSNQQQANLATAARYAEVANMNLNNKQQTALQNNMNTLQVELQNLTNKQQSYIANAQLEAALQSQQIDARQQSAIANAARFSDAANIQFSAEQQAQLHNSELMRTIGLAELNSAQAATLQNAAQLASMDMANLNNRQAAAVQNAQAFLQMDMTNLSNEQQTVMFKAQQNIQALFNDQAAENAAAQFNATSENQTTQFFATLAAQTSQFNAAQTNALEQFNVDSVNSLRQFNSEMQQQRDLFNAQNGLVVAQANAQWRQQIATTNNAAINESNRLFAQTMNEISANNMDRIWQRERDIMSFAVQTANSNADRATEILKQKMANEGALAVADAEKSSALAQAGGSLVSDIVGGMVGKVFGF
jgi:hypothetical protein